MSDKPESDAAAGDESPSRVWLPGIVANIARFLPPNEVAHSLRLTDKTASTVLHEHATVDMRTPVPKHTLEAFVARFSSPNALRDLTLAQRRKLVCVTAASGDVTCLESMIAAVGVVPSLEEMGAAAAAGHVDMCRWLRANGCPAFEDAWHTPALTAAAGANQREVCEWLLSEGARWTDGAVFAAARGGHTDLVEWLTERRPPGGAELDPTISQTRPHAFAHDLTAAVALGCDLPNLKTHWQRYSAQLDDDAKRRVLASAAASSRSDWADKVAWLVAEQGLGMAGAGRLAAGRTDGAVRLQDLVDRFGYAPDEERLSECVLAALQTEAAAASGTGGGGGGPEALIWLLKRSRTAPKIADVSDYHYVRLRPGLAKLQVLHSAGLLDRPKLALRAALASGDGYASAWLLGVCKEQDPRLRLAAPHAAAATRSGSVPVLSWLRQLRCPFRVSAWDCHTEETDERGGAAASGCEAALEWLVEAGCEPPADGSPYVTAACNGDLRTLAVLRRLGVPWGPDDGAAFAAAVKGGAPHGQPAPLAALQWLQEAGMPVRWREAAKAARNRWHADRGEVLSGGQGPGTRGVQAWVQERRQALAGERQGGKEGQDE